MTPNEPPRQPFDPGQQQDPQYGQPWPPQGPYQQDTQSGQPWPGQAPYQGPYSPQQTWPGQPYGQPPGYAPPPGHRGRRRRGRTALFVIGSVLGCLVLVV